MNNQLAKVDHSITLTKNGDLVVKKDGDFATIRSAILYTIKNPDGEEISYQDYQRIINIINRPETRMVEISDGDYLAVGQITRIRTVDKQVESKTAVQERQERREEARKAWYENPDNYWNKSEDELKAHSSHLREKLEKSGVIHRKES